MLRQVGQSIYTRVGGKSKTFLDNKFIPVDAAISPSIAIYVVLTYCATEASLKGSSNSTYKDYGNTVHSVYRGSYIFFLQIL